MVADTDTHCVAAFTLFTHVVYHSLAMMSLGNLTTAYLPAAPVVTYQRQE